jgi:hypothetical protein
MTRYKMDWGPLVVGGIGGSGTRVVAQILAEMGFYLGADLNTALDNLWFTLLFKRPRWFNVGLDDVSCESQRGCRVLRRALCGEPLAADDLRFVSDVVAELSADKTRSAAYGGAGGSGASDGRNGGADWAQARYESLRAAHRLAPAHALGWGWKEPNSHVFLPELAAAFDDLRFVLVLRHGLDMAFSDNQQQLANWGARYGVPPPADAADAPRRSLAFWVAANQRAVAWGEEHLGERFLLLRYEELCYRPEAEIVRLFDFLGHHPDGELFERLAGLPQPPASIGRFRNEDLAVFEDGHLDAVRRLGFDT